MPAWNEVLKEIQNNPRKDSLDVIRRKYLKRLHQHTKRNVIAYYSGWLQKPGHKASGITDDDKNGFMATINKLDRKKGLDLILHTPGGELSATESIVDYFRRMFGTNIRAIIPQLAMSAGTMIACACKEIVLGKESSIGPIDPQFNGIPAQGVLDEFTRAIVEAKKDPGSIPIWQTIIGKYHPTFIGECQHAVILSAEMVKDWLKTGMFFGKKDADSIVDGIVNHLNDHNISKTHSRHFNIDFAKKIGLNILDLESDQSFQDLVLTVHHAYMHTFAQSSVIKVVENHLGNAVIMAVRQ